MLRSNLKEKHIGKRIFVVRFSNNSVLCQIVLPKIGGDSVLVSAYSTELQKYGLDFGLKNIPATYATGLLCARKYLKYIEETYGDDEPSETRDVCFLSRGLKRPSYGSKMFTAVHALIHMGIPIPYSPTRTIGYNKAKKVFQEKVFDKIVHGQKISEYMQMLRETSTEKYERHFSDMIKKGVTPENIMDKYKQVINAIKEAEDVEIVGKNKNRDTKSIVNSYAAHRQKRLTTEERRLAREKKLEECIEMEKEKAEREPVEESSESTEEEDEE